MSAFSSAFSCLDWSFSLPDLCGAGGAGEHVASVRAFAPALSTSGALRCRWEVQDDEVDERRIMRARTLIIWSTPESSYGSKQARAAQLRFDRAPCEAGI